MLFWLYIQNWCVRFWVVQQTITDAHSTSGDKLVKSGHWSSLTSSSCPSSGKGFLESHGCFHGVKTVETTASSVRIFTSQTPERKSRLEQDGQELFQIHNMTAMEAAEEGWVQNQQPEATLGREAADKCSWCRRLMPSTWCLQGYSKQVTTKVKQLVGHSIFSKAYKVRHFLGWI